MGTPNGGINGTLATGLLAHWSFDNGSLLDESGNGKNLTMIGTVAGAPDKDGNINNAVDFSGIGNSLEVAFTNTILSPCISIWVKRNILSESTWNMLCMIRGVSSQWSGFGITLHGDAPAIATNINGAQFYDQGLPILSSNVFHNVVAQFDNDTKYLKIYVDKILKYSYYINGSISYSDAEKIQLGTATQYPYESNDFLDEVRIYSRTLSDGNVSVGEMATGEVAEIYDMGVNYTSPKTAEPTITPNSGTFSNNIVVAIMSPTQGDETIVFYTTNGSEPNETSSSFVGMKEIEVTSNMTIKAFALQNGYLPSEIVTKEYIIETEGGEGMDVGMPKLDIIFKGLGVSAVQRGSKGVAVLIIKDDTNKTFDFATYRSYADLTSTESAKYTADNLQYIKDALDGTPLKLIVARMDVAGTLADMLVKIRGIAPRNCWIGMAAGATVDHDAIVSWVKSERTNNKKCYKAVVFNATAPDSLAIVNFANTSVVFADARATQTGEKGVATLLGFFAGLPLTMSGIGKSLSYKFSSVIEPNDVETAVNAGKLVLYSEEGEVKVARAINSLQTTGQDVTDDMKFIIIVEAMDMIFTDIYETWNKYYKGKYKNFMTNQLLLVSAINAYFTGLANDLILDPLYENKTAIDTEKQRLANIPKYGADVVNSWDDNKAMAMTVGTNVFLKANIKILNAFEDLALNIYM